MAYNNWNNGGGWNRGGYDRRGPQGGGYYGGPQSGPSRGVYGDASRFENPNFPYEIGQRVIHRATGTELTVISYGREQLECRKPDLNSGWFYVHELDPVDNSTKK